MDGIDEDRQVLGVHVRVDTVAEVGDVALRTKLLKHLFYQSAQVLLKKQAPMQRDVSLKSTVKPLI